ncbi:MAG TPA: glycosyltransferase, partial [Acidimicrobiales bacterium]|nr:glycosyltransferase [Acidimicrobiales bacterium]
GRTGEVVSRPSDPEAVASALRRVLADEARRGAMGAESRRRAESEFSYDLLAARLSAALAAHE